MEPEMTWRRSTPDPDGQSVEFAEHDGIVYIRDSLNPSEVLQFGRDAWDEFVGNARNGDFNI